MISPIRSFYMLYNLKIVINTFVFIHKLGNYMRLNDSILGF